MYFPYFFTFYLNFKKKYSLNLQEFNNFKKNKKVRNKKHRMLKSMTGFGIAQGENERVEINVEIKSLNSKFLDANLKLPKEYSDKDIEIRNILSNTLERGKVSFSIDLIEKGEQQSSMSINKNLLKLYYNELKEASDFVGANENDLFKLALQMPRVYDSSSNRENM